LLHTSHYRQAAICISSIVIDLGIWKICSALKSMAMVRMMAGSGYGEMGRRMSWETSSSHGKLSKYALTCSLDLLLT
jgi:hypothetical protein